tara:strand:+ start:6666 stop:7535 length:870 start_codon:yes stop_codon:yes gene_type:complete
MIDYKFFTDFQKELYTKHGYMLDKLNNSTSFWYFNKREGKKSYRDVYAHNYYVEYAKKFESKRKSALKVLEIGVWKGFSLLLWQRYFPNAEIYGIDINLSMSFRGKSATELLKDEKRIQLFEFDACDKKNVDEFVKENGGDFDIIIEDGSHLGHHQILSTFYYMPLLKKDGIMAIEDIGHTYDRTNDKYMIIDNKGSSIEFEDFDGTANYKPIYEYFMLNYNQIKNTHSHKLYPLLIDKENVELLDNINIEWKPHVDKEVAFKDADLEGNTILAPFFGNAQLAFLTYKT